jgi:hypothetical protein
MMPIINGRWPLLWCGVVRGDRRPFAAEAPDARQPLPKNGRFSSMEIGRLLTAPFVSYRGQLIPGWLCPDIPRQTMPDPALVGFGAGT